MSTAASGTKRTPPDAVIRPFAAASDLKVTQYLVGASIMEPAATANLAALYTPVVFMAWLLLTHIAVVRYSGGWPSSVHLLLAGDFAGYYSQVILGNWSAEFVAWLSLGPTIVAPPIVLLALFELRHRNRFEDEMTRAIGEDDMRDIAGYYGTTSDALAKKNSSGAQNAGAGPGRSGFWVLEYDGRIIGAFGLDGVKPGEGLTSSVDHVKSVEAEQRNASPAAAASASSTATTDSPRTLRPRKSASSLSNSAASLAASSAPTSSYIDTVQLRRFATSLSFRPTGIEDDLLAHAANYVFSASSSSSSPLPPASNIIIAVRPRVQGALVKRLMRNGYRPVERGVGRLEVREVRGKAGWVEKLVTPIWPLDLSWRTYVLEKKVWETLSK